MLDTFHRFTLVNHHLHFCGRGLSLQLVAWPIVEGLENQNLADRHYRI
jgi:hypothetical protein